MNHILAIISALVLVFSFNSAFSQASLDDFEVNDASEWDNSEVKRVIEDSSQLLQAAKEQKFEGILRRIRGVRPQLTLQSVRITKFIDFFDKEILAVRTEVVEFQQRKLLVSTYMDGTAEQRVAQIKQIQDQIDRISPNMPEQFVRSRRENLNKRAELLRSVAASPTQNHFAELDRSIAESSKKLDEKRTIISELRDYKSTIQGLTSQIEFTAENVLDSETQKSQFTNSATYVFGGMIILVITGFFIMAIIDDRVRMAIFGGDSGIQFITLFAIVIAIVLFGVLGKLDGKDLSTLLSGLAGYILGRGSTSALISAQKKLPDPNASG